MSHSIRIIAGLLLGSAVSVAGQAEDTTREDLLAPPPPPKIQSGEVLEPEVTIFETDREKVEQYSINGRVYAVKIKPKGGPAYYLIDKDGDGELESRRNDIERGLNVPQWILFSWK